MVPMSSPTAMRAKLEKRNISRFMATLEDWSWAELPIAACSTIQNTQPETNQIIPKGIIRERFLLNLGDNCSAIQKSKFLVNHRKVNVFFRTATENALLQIIVLLE